MIRWKIRSRRLDETYIVLEGDITEHNSLNDIRVAGEQIVLNLARVRYINSVGSRQFLRFLARLSGHKVTAELCSPAMVELMNLVPTFANHLTVRSVIVPVECRDCEAESDIRVLVVDGDSLPQFELGTCDECSSPNELGVLPDRYFAFLRRVSA